MTTLTGDIDNDKDLPVLKEILTRFGLNYKIIKESAADKAEDKLLKRLKKSSIEINVREAGNIKLPIAKEAITEIEAELNTGI
jgi:ribosomal protein L1